MALEVARVDWMLGRYNLLNYWTIFGFGWGALDLDMAVSVSASLALLAGSASDRRMRVELT